jgi:hypothetical protein
MNKIEKLAYWKQTGEKYRSTPKAKIALLLRVAERRSKKNNWDFDLTKDWLSEKILAGKCEISNIPFNYIKKHKSQYNPFNPSIDRIDSSKGYIKENCRIVLACINMGIGEWGLDTYLEVAAKAVSYQKK